MVRIRMTRLGRTHRPFYRIQAIDRRKQRDGKMIENLGWYDPMGTDEGKSMVLNEERIKHWLSVGARPSDTMMDILSKQGLVDAEKWQATRASRIKRKVERMETEQRKADESAAAEKVAAEKAAAEEAAKAEAAASEAEPEGGAEDTSA